MQASHGVKMRKRITSNSALGWALLVATAAPGVAAQVYITPSTPGWAFVEETPTGSGAFVSGPGAPPSGSPGSLQLSVGNPGAELFYTQQYAGLALSQLGGLKYSTYVVSSALPVTATLQFDFDNDLTAPTVTYGGRAVFDPSRLIGAVTPGVWQVWDPMTQRAWWGSGTPGTRPLNSLCTQASPCTLAQIITAFPNGGVLLDLFAGAFGFKLGNGGGPSQVSIDSFTIGTAGPAGPVTQYNFAPAAPPPPAPVTVPTLADSTTALLAALLAMAACIALRRQRQRS
jgi:hypothetical protein